MNRWLVTLWLAATALGESAADDPLARVRAWPEVVALPARDELPNPFRFADGSLVRDALDWDRRRVEIESMIQWYAYGHLPGPPGNVVAEETSSRPVLDGKGVEKRVTLRFGPQRALSMRVGAVIPVGRGPFPVIVKNDVALGACPILERLVRSGYIVVDYLREDLDPDRRDVVGPAQNAYPGYDWGTIAVWAWGGMRVVDWLVTLDAVDPLQIVVTGHSRGGKVALLHGALDTRIAITNPNGSGAGGAGSYRVTGKRCETLEAITQPQRFGYWFSKRLRDFAGREERLPFDQHFLTALVAPRGLVSTDAVGDLWANPTGTQETWRATREVYRFLGHERRVGIHFRAGGHDQNAEDWFALYVHLERALRGSKGPDGRRFDEAPFPKRARTFRWKTPARTAWRTSPAAYVVGHRSVYRVAGRFGGWPANHGMWRWGDEILVGFSVGYYKDLGPRRHAIDRERPEEHWLARSFDGGESWTLEHPGANGQLVPRGNALHGTEPIYLRASTPRVCEGGIDFSHPDFALTARMEDVDRGPSSFHYSMNRGRTWAGPFRLPGFGTPGIAARTDYLVDGKDGCTLFLTAAKKNGEEGRPLCVRTTDGGKTWKLRSLIGPEPTGFAIMPSTVRLPSGKLITCVRRREGKRRWIEAFVSADDARSWSPLSTPVEDAGEGNPPSLVRLRDGRLCLTWGHRAPPYAIRATLSGDEGRSWSGVFALRGRGGGRDLGYTRTIQRLDGKLVTVYYFHDAPKGDRYIAATIWDPGQH